MVSQMGQGVIVLPIIALLENIAICKAFCKYTKLKRKFIGFNNNHNCTDRILRVITFCGYIFVVLLVTIIFYRLKEGQYYEVMLDCRELNTLKNVE